MAVLNPIYNIMIFEINRAPIFRIKLGFWKRGRKNYHPCNKCDPPCTDQLRFCKGKRELNRHYLERERA